MTCQIGLIEQEAGKVDEAHRHLLDVLQSWMPELERLTNGAETEQRQILEIANIVSAAACSLADIELETKNYLEALKYVQQARKAAQLSNALRKAAAEIMFGRILESIKLQDPAAEKAFREAIKLLSSTDRIAAQIQAHDILGRHLLKKGHIKAGDEELDIARSLSDLASAFSSSTICVEDESVW